MKAIFKPKEENFRCLSVEELIEILKMFNQKDQLKFLGKVRNLT